MGRYFPTPSTLKREGESAFSPDAAGYLFSPSLSQTWKIKIKIGGVYVHNIYIYIERILFLEDVTHFFWVCLVITFFFLFGGKIQWTLLI